jgi:cytochrome oxidase Cu insertion factor (SCO1/SenC/PrrC family)
MTAPRAPDAARGRRGFLALAALFLLPLAAAFLLYYGTPRWRPTGRANQGELIDPPRTLPALALTGIDGTRIAGDLLRDRWTLLYVVDGRCDTRCSHALYLTRQTRIALNRDADRVRRVLLAAGACCAAGELGAQHPDLVVARLSADQLALLASVMPATDDTPLAQAGGIYIVDPLGNLMLRYAPGAPDRALLDDLKRLLRLSHIG